MLAPTLIMAVLALICTALVISKGQGQQATGFKSAFSMLVNMLPLLFFSFLLASMIQILVPKENILRWIGAESGLRGIFLGTLVGAFTPGGPYVSLPIVASLIKTGAGMGVVVAFLTSWSLWAIARMPMEVGILGWQIAAVRFMSVFFFPPIAGIIAQALATLLKIRT